MTELTIEQACEHPENFLYVWTTKAYLSAINSKYATIIAQKAANQRKLLMLSADKYSGGSDNWYLYKAAIENAFKEAYNLTPEQALYKLALGETVAGKNYAAGVFGIGAIKTNTFKGYEFNGKQVTVDPETGHMFAGTEDLTGEYPDLIYKNGDKFQLVSEDGKFVSQYNKRDKKWYAKSYAFDGKTYSAATGSRISSADMDSIWEGIGLSLQSFIDWLLSLFTSGKEQINEKNTVPNQLDDGYVFESGFGEAGAILLALAAGGALIATSKGNKGKKNAKKA